jgi:hypothetical protein
LRRNFREGSARPKQDVTETEDRESWHAWPSVDSENAATLRSGDGGDYS